jgi:hypothetical protein
VYPSVIEIRDTGGDHRLQQEVANKIFAGLRSSGRWKAVFIDDMQKILDAYSPAG